jgi:hypothetical protein
MHGIVRRSAADDESRTAACSPAEGRGDPVTTARIARSPRILAEWWLFFAAAFALTFAGFWPSFFAALSSTQVPLLIHGFSATAWMLLPILQAWLIRTRRRIWHRRIGWASLGLAAVVVLSGLHVLQLMTLRNLDDFQLLRLKFVYLDLTGLFLFSVFLGLAIWAARRRDYPLHLRLIACTALIPLEAAIERLLINSVPSLVPDFDAGLYAALIFMEVTLIALIVGEWLWRRVRWPFPFLLMYYLVMHATLTPVAEHPGFQFFAWGFARIGS